MSTRRNLTTLTLGLGLLTKGVLADGCHVGPLYDDFNLTLAPGHRTEVAGPLYYFEQRDTQNQWAMPPLWSCTRDPAADTEEFDFIYPILTYDRFGTEYRFQIIQLFAFAGGQTQPEAGDRRFTLFPFYFQQRSTNPARNYTALLPFYGRLLNRLFRDEIRFILFPVYSQTRKRDVVTDNYLFPIFHLRHGNQLGGWQAWPLLGHEHKDVTWKTNLVDEAEAIGAHDKWFALWPFFFNTLTGIGTTNPTHELSFIPAYSQLRSPERDSTTFLWPFFNIVDDRGKKYREWDLPWPFIVFARGEGKTTSRIWPLFSQAHDATRESGFYLWPVYKYNRLHADPLDRERTRILFFLYSDVMEKNTATGKHLRRVDLWPLFTCHRDFNGDRRLQLIAPLEPFLPNHKSIERNWSPLWSLWRSETSGQTNANSQSLLWNLYRRDVTPEGKKCSLLFGLFQYESGGGGEHWRLLYLPFGREPAKPAPAFQPVENGRLKNE
jgi:hypothetical protein